MQSATLRWRGVCPNVANVCTGPVTMTLLAGPDTAHLKHRTHHSALKALSEALHVPRQHLGEGEMDNQRSAKDMNHLFTHLMGLYEKIICSVTYESKCLQMEAFLDVHVFVVAGQLNMIISCKTNVLYYTSDIHCKLLLLKVIFIFSYRYCNILRIISL